MTRTNKIIAFASLTTALTGLLLVGCSSTHQDAPTPSSDHIVNGTNTTVIQMPDGFRNVTITCWDHTGIYVTSAGYSGTKVSSAIAIVLNDPHCGGTPQ